MKSKNFILILILLIAAVFTGYYIASMLPKPAAPAEKPLTTIELADPIADRSAELSGLAWHGDTLILLPQYPERFGEVDGAIKFYASTQQRRGCSRYCFN